MLYLIRIPFAILYFYVFYRGFFQSGPLGGVEVSLLMFCLLLGAILMSILWAPVIGNVVSDPLTSALTANTSLPTYSNKLMQLILRLEHVGARRTALLLCFFEGLRYPELPHPSLLALRNSKPGSLLEKWLAREVYQFQNVKNCLHAYRILAERHHETPPPHPSPEVNLAVYGSNRSLPPPAPRLEVPRQPPAVKSQRNPRIRLFGDL